MKKGAIAAVTSAAIIAAAGFSAYAVKEYKNSDLKDLSGAILGENQVKESHDVNDDGVVDVFDLTELRKYFNEKCEMRELTLSANEDNVNFIGRNYCDENDVAWLVQSGSAVEFVVNAASAEIEIKSEGDIAESPDSRPRYAVLLDGEVIIDETLGEASKTVKLFEGTSSRTAVVKVIHLSEANNGAVGVAGITVQSDSKTPAVPTPEKELKIEFIGDSITCGYGVDGESQYENFKTSTENFMKSYAYLTAQKLDAEYSAVCYSGHGIVSGYTGSGTKNEEALVPPYYEYVGKPEAYNVPWDFDKNQSDVVVINLGTNDSTYCGEDTALMEEYGEKYLSFLKTVRTKNPGAYIICTLGTMGADSLYPYIENAVDSFKAETGDERIMCYRSATQDPDDGYGSDWHPSAVTQQKSAYVLADKICGVLGIESDQVGIDAAAEASHELYLNTEAGANGAEYYSDYGRSYWINVVTGGNAPEDIQAVYSDITLKKDGVYTFSFTCTAPAGMEIPVLIRNRNDSSIVYFDGTITGGEEKAPFEAEVTAPENADAEIVFLLGGGEYYSATIYGVSLLKKA